jgi:hypothetical protein
MRGGGEQGGGLGERGAAGRRGGGGPGGGRMRGGGLTWEAGRDEMATPCRCTRCPCRGAALVVSPAEGATRRSVTASRDRPAPQPLREQE